MSRWIVLALLTVALSAVSASAAEPRSTETRAGTPAQGPAAADRQSAVAVGVPAEVSTPAPARDREGTESASTLYRAVVEIRTGEELFRARRLGVDVRHPGSEVVEVPRDLLAALNREGIRFRVIGGTTRYSLPSDLAMDAGLPVTQAAAPDAPQETGTLQLSSGIVDLPIDDATGSAQGYRLRQSIAPAGAEVTDLRYRTRISDNGDGDFWCGDYEIYLFSGDFAFELRVYDNLGGATDGGFDDDSADDADIYLNWRSTSFFDGEDPNQWWGILVYDNLAGDDGQMDYIEFEVDWAVPVTGDSYEPDDDWWQAWVHPHNYTSAFRSLAPVGDQDWITFSLSSTSDVVLETDGPGGDTELWLYDGSVNQIDYNDDGGSGLFSRISRSGLPPGTYFARVQEFGNNGTIADYAISLGVTAGTPDLVATSFTWPGNVVVEGEPFWVELDVGNAGGGPAGSSHARLFLSVDGDFDTSDDYEVLPEKGVSALGAGASTTVRWDFTFPDVLDSTSYLVWLVFEVDSRNEVAESNEDNTYKAGNTDYLTVWQPVDLVATDVYLRSQAGGGGSVVAQPVAGQQVYPHLDFTINAESPVPGPTWWIELNGTPLCEGSGALGGGAYVGWCTSPWTVTAGLHSLHGEVDPDGITRETNENNNDTFRNYTVAGSGTPDIRVEPLDLFFTAPGGTTAEVAGASEVPAADPPVDPEVAWDRLFAAAGEKGGVRVLVRLDVPFQPEGGLAGVDAVAAQRERFRQAREALLQRLQGTGARETARFRTIPYVALEVGGAALEALRATPLVVAVEEDRPQPPTLSSSVPVIGGDDAWAAGYTGAGLTVAVLDSGVEAAHPFFSTGGGRVVAEGCYSSNTLDSSSVCPGGAEVSTAVGAGGPCPAHVDGCDHGTHVAGIALGDDGSGPNIGVARDASLISVQVFSRFDAASTCNPVGRSAPCALSYPSDQIQGMERVYDLRTNHDIAAVNMSLGGDPYTSQAECDAEHGARKAVIDNLRSAGIATVIASGNDDLVDAISTPACISTAVSVGATTDADSVASFSNVAPFLDLVAPGVGIVSSVPGGGTASKPGTSMAAPHVAGAWALMKQARPAGTVDEILDALRTTATTVSDGRSGGVEGDLRRINVDLAIDALGSQGFTVFNDGDDVLTVTSMAASASAPWISWSPPAPFSVAPGSSRPVAVSVDFSLAPAGTSERRILVYSDDGDESPYPGGVDVHVEVPTATCHALTRNHTGSGGDPVTSPVASSGCSAGSFVAGETIALTASPAGGWRVGSWSGTAADASTSTQNGLTMPAAPHTVTAHYVEDTACAPLTLSNQVLSGTSTFEACGELWAGDGVSVVAPGAVTFRSGTRVVLGNGFSVGSGASFRAETDGALLSAGEPASSPDD